MGEVGGSSSWRDELATLIEDSGVRYAGDPMEFSAESFEVRRSEYVPSESLRVESDGSNESFKDQAMGFLMAWCEILMELGRGCGDIIQQNLLNDNSYVVRKLRGPCAKVSKRLRFLNEYLPEDRDPVQAWSVVFFVFILALAAISVDPNREPVALAVKMRTHAPNASRIQLPDGRYMAYHEQGVPADKARLSLISPHSFLSSRLSGIPGVRASLLEQYGVRLVTYDLPGFGESDPHPNRNLNSSAMDMLHLAAAVNVSDKFWVLCHSSGCIHAWAALRYNAERIAGAAMLAPMINPYEAPMTKDETRRTWGKWSSGRKIMYFVARRFPKFLSYFYRKSFFSGKHDRIDKQLSFSLGKKDEILIEEPTFEDCWQRDVEESVRQGNIQPFIEEAVLQVSNWGFDLVDLKVQKKCQTSSILLWIRSMYSQAECELAGFLGPIHIWQGLDDRVVPPSMAEYVRRVLPEAVIHKLPNEGHFSYFFFCDECHRQIFSTLFGTPQGPLERRAGNSLEEDNNMQEVLKSSASDME